MSKVSVTLLFLGIIIGLFVGGVAIYAALDLNPQNQFTDDPIDLIPIFLGNAGGISFPFAFAAALAEIIRFFKSKKQKA